LITDVYAGITNIDWTVYNKPDEIYKAADTITYAYNTANQRINKTYNGVTTWYVRDAQGNVLAVYDSYGGNVIWREQDLYGSSRLGMWTPNLNLANDSVMARWDTLLYRQYELTNHLGNVLETITDLNVISPPEESLTVPGQSHDYYPGGMLMPGRQFTATGDSLYRYGFNSKENDNEVYGLGNLQDYGARMYIPQIVRFPSVDPVSAKYPDLSSYQFASNNPIANLDVDGKEGKNFFIEWLKRLIGVGPAPKTADEAIEDENLRDAATKVDNTIDKIGEAEENSIGLIPGVSAAFELEKGNTKTAVAYFALDIFGDELLRYGGKAAKYGAEKLFKLEISSVELFGKASAEGEPLETKFKNLEKIGKRAWYKYQGQINGISGSFEFLRHGTKFDGYKNGILLEAKSQYQWLIKTGRVSAEELYGKMAEQLGRQIDAAKGLKLEWHFAEEKTMGGFEEYLKETDKGSQMLKQVELKYTPAVKQ